MPRLIVGDQRCDLAVEVSNLAGEQVDHGLDGGEDALLPGAVTMQLIGLAHIGKLSARLR